MSWVLMGAGGKNKTQAKCRRALNTLLFKNAVDEMLMKLIPDTGLDEDFFSSHCPR